MISNKQGLQRSVVEQIAIHDVRTPTRRYLALRERLDTVRGMASADPESIEQRRRVKAVSRRQKEKLRGFRRRHAAAGRSDAEAGAGGAGDDAE